MKLNSKQWAKVRLNQENKVITFTKQVFKSKSEGEKTLGTSKSFVIVNQNALDKMKSDGWKIAGEKEEWQPQYIVNDPVVEEQIRAYTESKMRKQAVKFVSGVTQRNQRCAVTAREVFGETKFKSEQPISVRKAYEKFERTRVGRERAMESTIR